MNKVLVFYTDDTPMQLVLDQEQIDQLTILLETNHHADAAIDFGNIGIQLTDAAGLYAPPGNDFITAKKDGRVIVNENALIPRSKLIAFFKSARTQLIFNGFEDDKYAWDM